MQPQPATLQRIRQSRLGRIAASSGSPTMRATSAARNPPGAGPRTTTPTFGLTADTHGAIAAAAAHERTSAGVINTTRSAASSAVSDAGGGPPRHVADHRRAAAATRVDHGAQGCGVDIAPGAAARQHTDSAVAR